MITNMIILISVIVFLIINFIDKSDDKVSLAIKYGAFYIILLDFYYHFQFFLPFYTKTLHFPQGNLPENKNSLPPEQICSGRRGLYAGGSGNLR